ncbi:Aminoglycoside N(6')-acetyltransferase type 1 [Marinomonas spartinae]|uniref:Aminoglycoside N(6')-acetyltransferase type 1 n=1 Tax=Marinomonas spartinae TaxID=1792290 RepID=A0A1A8T4I9_9GAMM|nr:GNAT family N-acetyltransferase [Marinomonas spartinae]SBS26068.1 Aminoglycoside N(6')-acetyltransferase type 1 [Marinomonas spartinae]SBS39944.1 Aminoglycoside N(6')-acetyltransferase type 1 [Marinomonas spartinae]
MTIDIRAIQITDAAAWSALRVEFLPEIKDISQTEVDAFFQGTYPNVREVLVAFDDSQKMVGFIELNLRENVPGSRQQTTPYIEAWFVSPDYQGRGIGKTLIYAAEEWATQQGFQELASDAPITNKKSIHLQKQLGFNEIERVVCLLKPLRG